MSAAEQPLSTLSADADTASYANLRRLVRSGAGLGTIDPGAVRIEEMLNYFDYDYAAPAEGEDFALTARAGACPWNAESELVVLGLTVGQAATEAPPTNLVLLVDVSGSMGGRREASASEGVHSAYRERAAGGGSGLDRHLLRRGRGGAQGGFRR